MAKQTKPSMKKFSARAGAALPVGDILANELTNEGVSRSLIRKAHLAGFVYINGRRAESLATIAKPGSVIDAYINLDELKKAALKAEAPESLRVLYEDEAVICFDKPPGIPTQPTMDSKRANLFDLAKKQYPDTYLALHHRLDRDTSGVILLARDARYNKFIADQFADHEMAKQYIAVVHGRIPRPRGRLESYMGSLGNIGPKGMQKFGSVKSGGKKAITEFEVIDSSSKFSLIQVQLHTGRTHQIRVHMSEDGHSIVGDTLYGSSPEWYTRLGRFLLHAQSLTFIHPITKGSVRVESPVPPQFLEMIQK